MTFKDLVKRNLEQLENSFDTSLSGVHIHNESKIFKADRFFDGHIIDWQGNIKQEFEYKYLSTITKKGYLAQKEYESNTFGLFTKDNKPIWKKHLAIHHDMYPTKKSFFTFSKVNKKYKGRMVDFDTVLEFDYKGNQLGQWSSFDNLTELQKHHKKMPLDIPFLPTGMKRKTKSPWGGFYDYYRFNSFQLLPKNLLEKNDKRFQKGNWLISARHGSLIFILDKDTKEVVYSLSQKDVEGEIQGQHAVQLLENGNLLIFDNGRYRGWSRIIEINPITKHINFEYKDDSFFTKSRGYVQKLPNDNYLITESEKGRIFEITEDKELVWEYYHPEKQNDKNYPQSIGKREWIYQAKAV